MAKIGMTAHTLAPRVRQWLQNPAGAALLHLFDQVINLVDADGEIISVVQSPVESGPFSLVVGEERPFPQLIPPKAPVTKTANGLTVGPLAIDCRAAAVWQPAPNWQQLQANQVNWRSALPEMETAVNQHLNAIGTIGPANFAEQFQTAITQIQAIRSQEDPKVWKTAVAKLAGLGPGFTPAGDDFLVGFLFGLWATRPEDEVMKMAEIVVETAVPRTTQLSTAWLQAAGLGEAWLPWHELIDSLVTGQDWRRPIQQILKQGATSGVAALLGFIAAT